MSFHCTQLCLSLISEHFGDVVRTVAQYLFLRGSQNLRVIAADTNVPLIKVKESLCVLIKHGFVFHREDARGHIWYSVDWEKILAILRYPRFLLFVKKCCGDEAEVMLEEILKQGWDTASELIIKTYKKMLERQPGQPQSLDDLLRKFELLVKDQFLMRSQSTNTMGEVSTDKPDFSMPTIDINAVKINLEGGQADPGDNKIYWRANIDRLTQDLRDVMIINTVTNIVDDNAGELMRQMLFLMYERTASWSETSNPIPYIEIKERIKGSDRPVLSQYLDQYLRMIQKDSRQFLRKMGDSGGGQFTVMVKEVFSYLTWGTLETTVLKKFGPKAVKIFKVIKTKKYIEMEGIQQIAMIPSKEATNLTLRLMKENYIQMQELRKIDKKVSAIPSKAFFLFHIDINQVVRAERQRCYRAVNHMRLKRERETADNKRLLDKQLRTQTILTTLKESGAPEEQLREIEEMLTPSEKAQLENIDAIIRNLSGAELKIEESIFLFTVFLRYH